MNLRVVADDGQRDRLGQRSLRSTGSLRANAFDDRRPCSRPWRGGCRAAPPACRRATPTTSAARSCPRRSRRSDTRIGVPFFVATTMLLKSCGGVDAAHRAQQQLSLPCSTAPPGISTFSATTASRTCVDRQPVRIQLLDVDDDVDLAGAAAGDGDLADAVDRLDRRARPACRPARSASAGSSSSDETISDITGSASGSTLRDHRRQQLGRHALDRGGDLLAHVVDALR